ncbi:MAG: tyrosine-type recombinase/integrase [Flammeovirgaceae bacterium]|nr:MAG: tyrosine-type recombinase/integrase [Flammeovirgaceae bacterium]
MGQRSKTVVLKPVEHRGMDCIAIQFPYDETLLPAVRKVPGATFSKTMKCWYTPASRAGISQILNAFRGIAWVDLKQISSHKGQPGPVEQPTAKPEAGTMPVLIEPEIITIHELQTEALEAMRKKLKLKNYSPSTIRTYTEQFKLFMQFFPDSNPEDLGEEEIVHYLMHLIEKRKLSVSTQNQAINAIKFYYEKVLKQEKKVYELERPMQEKKLPEVLSQEEVMLIFEATENLKHRTMLMLLYASGLRRSELLNLRVGDVDVDRGVVLIRGGKGRKDRHSVLAQSLIPIIEKYIAKYRPAFWLFEGVQGERYSATSLQQILKRAVAKAGIRKNVRLHMLRHSFATHLLEAGTSTRYIQVLLGHQSPKTTEVYAKVTRFGLDKVVSPLDQIVASKQLRSDSE